MSRTLLELTDEIPEIERHQRGEVPAVPGGFQIKHKKS